VPADLREISAELDANLPVQGERTEHLAGFLVDPGAARPQAIPRSRKRK
jgi:hypothetical protein